MNHHLHGKDRHLIPRWRNMTYIHQTIELATPFFRGSFPRYQPSPIDFENKLMQWKINPCLESATDLIGASLIEAKESSAESAAHLVLAPQSTSRPLTRYLAKQVLNRSATTSKISGNRAMPVHARKRKWRDRTRMYPRNALAWVELSLLELIEGRDKIASRAMEVALQLAPDHRHIVRSASRLFVHLGELDRAYDTVVKSRSISSDPWLIAAELSLSELRKRSPRYVKQGRFLIENHRFDPHEVTELAVALGILELNAGKRKRARDLFLLSLIRPTGNTLAQLEWMAYKGILLLEEKYRIERWTETDEAMAYRLGREEKLAKVPDACMKWSEIEPFSSRPYVVGSTALTIVGDSLRAAEFAEMGLKFHPKNPLLLNNYAFALAHLGKTFEAVKVLRQVRSDDKRMTLLTDANRGLVAMRMSDHRLGRIHYEGAISGFQKADLGKMADVARIYFAREAAIAKLPDAAKLLAVAREANRRLRSGIHKHILGEAEAVLRDGA